MGVKQSTLSCLLYLDWVFFRKRVIMSIWIYSYNILTREIFCPKSDGEHQAWFWLWRNHPKLLGPGALIFVAKQHWPKLALTGSSSSEASTKATLFQYQQTTLTRRWAQRLQHNHFIHLRVIAAERKFITNHVRSSKYYGVPTTQIIQVSLFSGSNKR